MQLIVRQKQRHKVTITIQVRNARVTASSNTTALSKQLLRVLLLRNNALTSGQHSICYSNVILFVRLSLSRTDRLCRKDRLWDWILASFSITMWCCNCYGGSSCCKISSLKTLEVVRTLNCAVRASDVIDVAQQPISSITLVEKQGQL